MVKFCIAVSLSHPFDVGLLLIENLFYQERCTSISWFFASLRSWRLLGEGSSSNACSATSTFSSAAEILENKFPNTSLFHFFSSCFRRFSLPTRAHSGVAYRGWSQQVFTICLKVGWDAHICWYLNGLGSLSSESLYVTNSWAWSERVLLRCWKTM